MKRVSEGRRAACPRCSRPEGLCWCKGLEPVRNTLPVLVFRNEKEARHPLNTAAVLGLGLSRCEIINVGDRQEVAQHYLPDPWLLFPGESSVPPGELPAGRPGTLVVPDATWRKSRAMVLASGWLQSLPRVGLAGSGSNLYRLRHCGRADSLSTMEAVVQVLGMIEQQPDKYASLYHALEKMMSLQERFLPRSQPGG